MLDVCALRPDISILTAGDETEIGEKVQLRDTIIQNIDKKRCLNIKIIEEIIEKMLRL